MNRFSVFLAVGGLQFIFVNPPTVTNPISSPRLPSGQSVLPEPIWSTYAGVIGGIPNILNQCGSTIAPYTGTAATINTAITNCSSGGGGFVLLGNGVFTLSTGINLASNVALRGGGADQTELDMTTGVSCGPINGGTSTALICFPGPNTDGTGTPQNQASWSAGYSKGQNVITLGANTSGAFRPTVGTILHLDQIVDGTTTAADRWQDIFTCQTANVCVQVGNGGSPQSGRGTGATARSQYQAAQVTAVNGNNFTIVPPIMMNNWRSSQTPLAWWITSTPTHNAGVEDLFVKFTGTVATSTVGVAHSHDCWIKGVKSQNAFNASTSSSLRTMTIWYSTNITVRDGYIFDGTDISNQDGYAITVFVGGNMLFENNIIQWIRTATLIEQGSNIVNAYNFVIRNVAPAGCGQLAGICQWDYAGVFDNHGVSGDFDLIEGNDGTILDIENYHGNSQFPTAFRNRLAGRDAALATNQTAPIMNYGYSRFPNYIGNVLGLSGYHTRYQFVPGDGGTQPNCQVSVFNIGSGGDCNHVASGGGGFPADDVNAPTSAYRWGNYDVVNGVVRFNSSEVPTSLSFYPQQIPSTQVLPSSLYLANKPNYFSFSGVPFPPIGPDVTGGDIANVGGHAYRNPARKCFEVTMGGTFADTAPKTFSRTNCYGT